jgi:integrase
MTRREGSIIQRSKGSWQIRYYAPPDAQGKQKRLTETIRGRKSDAEAVLRERLSTIQRGEYVPRQKETLAQFMESWLDGHAASHVSPRTLQGYRQKANSYIIPCLGRVQVQSLTPRHVRDLHKWMLEKGLSKQSVVHAHRLLSEALEDATDWGIIARNPAEKVSPPRPDRKDLQVWGMAEIKQFLEAAKDSPFADAFLLFLYTGMRRSELTGLKWEGIDFDTKTLRITGTLQRVSGHSLLAGPPKTASSRRSIALGETAITLLHAIRGKQLALKGDLGDLYDNRQGYVFTDLQGNPIDSNRLSREFHRIVKENGLPPVTLHSLRHCHASLLLAEGVNIKAISERLGHSDIRLTLQVYSHLLPGLQANAAEALDRRLAAE